MQIKLGMTVKDKITGLQGIAMSKIEYLTNCTHFGVQPQVVTEKDQIPDWTYFDERRLEIVDTKNVLEGTKEADNGGPESNHAPKL